jgi:hypothetical protein
MVFNFDVFVKNLLLSDSPHRNLASKTLVIFDTVTLM